MLERNIFLFGFVDKNEGSVTERINELTEIQNARIQVAYKKLFVKSRIEHFIHMDLGKELDVDTVKKMSKDYAEAKKRAIKGASEVVDVQNIRHIAENERLIGDVVEKTANEWNVQKEMLYEQTGLNQQLAIEPQNDEGDENFERIGNNENIEQEECENYEQGDIENFGEEIEQLLSEDS